MILGTVSSAGGGMEGITITIDGETEPTTKRYSFLAPYYPREGDRVLIAEISGEYVILGKIQLTRPPVGAHSVDDLNNSERRIGFYTDASNNFYIGYFANSGGSITWKKLTTS